MPYHHEKHPHLPALIVTLAKDYDEFQHGQASMEVTQRYLDEASTPLFLVYVIERPLEYLEIVEAANAVARGDSPLWKHPMARQAILVTRDVALSFAAKGFASDAFGNLNVGVFSTVEEALAYIAGQ